MYIQDVDQILHDSHEHWKTKMRTKCAQLVSPHPRVFYVLKDVANLLVKVGVTSGLYARMVALRSGVQIPYEPVLAIADPGLEARFKSRFAQYTSPWSGLESFFCAQEVQTWVDGMVELGKKEARGDYTTDEVKRAVDFSLTVPETEYVVG